MVEAARAWRPDVPLVREVLHATFQQHAYPAHTHEDWTVLLVDDGVVTYTMDRTEHHAEPAAVTVLPPLVPHDGRSAVAGAPFRKRVLYLDAQWLPAGAAAAAVPRPTLADPAVVSIVEGIHAALRSPGGALAAEGAVWTLRDTVAHHLGTPPPPPVRDVPLARRLRHLLDDRLTETFTLSDAGRVLDAHPSHLVRAFSQAYGIPPHRYVTGRRVDRARRLLLDGRRPAEAAVGAGFHDQAHLTRHFRRLLGTTPGAFVAADR